jgi:hypothetical protein
MSTADASDFACAPVTMAIFRRPDTARQVFDAIRQARPKRLFIFADGPRSAAEAERCRQTRAVVEHVDWDCEVQRQYSDVNLGIRRRMSSGTDWAFTYTDEMIFLEDDCVPHPDFFRFATAMLERYREDARVMIISGTCPIDASAAAGDYFFSRYALHMGCAMWKRAWASYDVAIAAWNDPAARAHVLSQFESPAERRFWVYTFDRVADGRMNTWDFQIFFNLFMQRGLSVIPRVNLVRNVGFGAESTNTIDTSQPYAHLSLNALPPPYAAPPAVERWVEGDRAISDLLWQPYTLWQRAWWKGRRLMTNWLQQVRPKPVADADG